MSYPSMRDELEKLTKIAAGPEIIHRRFVKKDRGSAFFDPIKNRIELPYPSKAIPDAWRTHMVASMTAPRYAKEIQRDAYRSSRRHELTHWLRHKRGKLPTNPQVGLRGVGRTAMEEAIAYRQGLKRLKTWPGRLGAAAGIPGGIISSIRHVYPQGVVKALLGIKR
jgi:hypothetical protein